MRKQNGKQAFTLQRPTTNSNQEAWKAYWKSQGQSWRTEPEIDTKRQEQLTHCRTIVPDIQKGMYPFKNVEPKLTRADIEWLLTTHESGGIVGPVDWQDRRQHKRVGLDLRGADLCRENLHDLPLARILGGPTFEEAFELTQEQQETASVLLCGADLVGAQLQKANLMHAQLQGANLMYAQLQGANLSEAQLQGADLMYAQLQKAGLSEAQLQKAYLVGAQLQGANLSEAQLQGANLMYAELQKANLSEAQLQKANLRYAQLQKANLMHAQLQGANLGRADLEHAHLDQVTLSDEKYGVVSLVDIRWGDNNLAVVDWTPVKKLGDEHNAHETKDVDDYRAAVRANRQLAVVLRNQGLNEEADHFAYRAQRLQRIVLWKQRKYGRYLFSGILDLLAGYGYRPLRSVFWYLVTLIVFALAYSTFGHLTLWPPDAYIYSLTSFHGRGFFPGLEGKHSLHDPLIMFASLEAVVGLFIEISFIATFTQRFFGK